MAKPTCGFSFLYGNFPIPSREGSCSPNPLFKFSFPTTTHDQKGQLIQLGPSTYTLPVVPVFDIEKLYHMVVRGIFVGRQH